MKDHHLDSKIEAYLDQILGADETRELSALLQESAHARDRYWELAAIHGFLEQSLQNSSLKSMNSAVVPLTKRSRGIFRDNPLTAAAAGLAIGILSVAMMWAYSESRSDSQVSRKQILFESFEEDASKTIIQRFPDRAGQWFGTFSTGQSTKGDLEPWRGKSVGKFEPISHRKYSYAWHIIDLDEISLVQDDGSHQLEVKASFASSSPTPSVRYQIRLAAFAQEPDAVRPIWNNESILFDNVLQHSARNFESEPDQEGWKKLYARLDLPPGARSVVISLGVAGLNNLPVEGEHYLDAVRARIITSKANQD